ncbi:MAG: potassium transporter TrkG [Mucinivorans sp.]
MIKEHKIGQPRFVATVRWFLRSVLLMLAFIVPLMVIYEFGYPIHHDAREIIHNTYRAILNIEWLILTILYVLGLGRERGARNILSHSVFRSVIYGIVSLIVVIQLALVFGWLQSDGFLSAITSKTAVRGALLLMSTVQISRAVTGLLGRKTNPSLILATSFAIIIIIGSLLLMLPRCTYGEISWLNALFVSTSAVCVTGLTPVDVAQTFTMTGQLIILILIQIGGLGIMTITSFFGLFFAGGRSFSGQMVVGDMLSTERLSSLLHTIVRILVVTFSIEAIGAIFLYFAIINAGVMDQSDALYFGIFHSVSAFCNAGFSTLSQGLADPILAALNSVRYVIGLLIIFGGIGFPIFSNFLSIFAHKFRNILRSIYGIRPTVRPRLWSLNSFIVVRTTTVLVISASVLFLIMEWNATLDGMPFVEKLSQAFLMAVTPRTAGFNGVDLTQMIPASMLLTIALMWIGGAPQSTAGGIKVTTIYVALKNIFSSTSASGRLEVHRRQVPTSSVARAFTVIVLSIITIGVAVTLLSIFDPEIETIDLLYEVVSAISTVGLSMATTPLLSEYSKIVLILLMFAGRVGLVSIFMIFIKRNTTRKPYTYPEENILIN